MLLRLIDVVAANCCRPLRTILGLYSFPLSSEYNLFGTFVQLIFMKKKDTTQRTQIGCASVVAKRPLETGFFP